MRPSVRIDDDKLLREAAGIGFAGAKAEVRLSHLDHNVCTCELFDIWCLLDIQGDAAAWMDGVRASITLGGLINKTIELLTIIQNHSVMNNILDHTIEIFAEYEGRGADYCVALNFGVDRLLKIRRIIRIIHDDDAESQLGIEVFS